MSGTLLVMAVAASLALSGYVAVKLIAWAKRNRARAAGTLASGMAHSPASLGDQGWWETFRDWLGEKFDAFAESGSGSAPTDGGQFFDGHDGGGGSSGGCGGDAANVCSGDGGD